MWYVYILQSKKARFLYVGMTNNINRRFKEHNSGKTQSTKFYKPFELISFIAVKDKRRAVNLEKYLKKGSGKTILKKRILNDEDLRNYEVISET